MARLNGALNLSKIPQRLIRTNSKGEKIIYVNVDENYRGADNFGNTHTITLYDKENARAIYLANLKPQERQAEKVDRVEREDKDLPFM